MNVTLIGSKLLSVDIDEEMSLQEKARQAARLLSENTSKYLWLIGRPTVEDFYKTITGALLFVASESEREDIELEIKLINSLDAAIAAKSLLGLLQPPEGFEPLGLLNLAQEVHETKQS